VSAGRWVRRRSLNARWLMLRCRRGRLAIEEFSGQFLARRERYKLAMLFNSQ
jgi:hypothetical protein